MLYQEFTQLENPASTIQNKEEEEVTEPGIDAHMVQLTAIHNIFNKYLPKLQKYEAIASKSGCIEISILALDTHILTIKIVERTLRYQKSMCKMLHVLLTLFIHLTYNGFCGEKDQDEEEEGEGEKGDNFDFNDGTGMGEGKGMKNVSDEIEHEEQLEGLKDEQGDPDDEEDEKQEKKEEDKAFDMKNDFDGENEDKKEDEEDKKKEKDEIDSQELDDEMDDVDNKLDNELFNEDNEISSEEDEDNNDNKDENKPPVDLEKEIDLDHKDKEAKGNEENKEDNEKDKDNEQKEKEIEHEQKNEINDQNEEEQEQPNLNIDDQIKEDGEEEKEPEENKEDGQTPEDEEMEREEESNAEDEVSVEGDHKFDPTKEDDIDNGPEEEPQNDFDIENLENMDGSEGGNEENVEEQPESEQLEDENNEDHDVEAENNQKPDEEDQTFAPQVQNDKKQENNSLGNNMDKGQKQEEQDQQDAQQNEEKKDFNNEENDYLFQVMQQYLDNKEKKEQKKPKEGERNEDQNMKKAQNIEEIEDLPDQAEGNDEKEDENAQDFAKDDKAKEMRSNVADTVKYNDEEMEAEENQEELKDNLPPPEDKDEEMSEVEDKDLAEVQDEEQIKSLMKTNEFYQKYLEDKNKKEKEEKLKEENQTEEADQANPDQDKNEDVHMEEESEEEDEIKLVKEEFKITESSFDILELRQDMIERYEKWRKDKELVSSSYELLNKFKKTTNHLSISLCEQMRMILEPTEKSRLKGDYKSGKRINIKKIIPFIASNYRNDKIWLRREMPFKRDYRVIIAIDDSLSMHKNKLGFFALESLVAISEALNQLNVGKVCVCGINDRMKMHMSFEDTYSAEKAAFCLSNYSFEHSSLASADTSIPNFMADCNKLLDSLHNENKNIVFIISDGRFNKKKALPYIMKAEEKNHLSYMFILLDNHDIDSNQSVFKMKTAQLITDENGKQDYKMTRYLEDFPFKYFTVVQQIAHLPKVLSNIFLQWLTIVNS